MNQTVKVNFALQPETVVGIEKLCKETYRSKSDLVDYLVAKEMQSHLPSAKAPALSGSVAVALADQLSGEGCQ